jgi:Flp pilus assembly pilin Flp
VRAALWRFIEDESGQDLAEYALLAVFLGLAALVVWNAMAMLIGGLYFGYDAGVQGAWEPPDPGLGS